MKIILALVVMLFVAGCNQKSPAPVPTPTAIVTPQPTATVLPQPTPYREDRDPALKGRTQ